MARALADYVALAIIRKSEIEKGFYTRSQFEDFSGDFPQLRELAQSRTNFPISDDVLHSAIRTLADWQLVRVTDDPYSGTFYKIRSEQLEETLRRSREERVAATGDGLVLDGIVERRSDYPLAAAMILHEVFEDYDDHGEDWLTRALAGLKQRVEEGDFELDKRFEFLADEQVPASDRIVRLNDNQISELDSASTELIEAVADRNEVGSQVGLRELILGQLKAGRELFRSGCVRVHLVNITLIETLKFLAKRYEREAIGALASALMVALFNHFGISG